jgi:hypothetical protein
VHKADTTDVVEKVVDRISSTSPRWQLMTRDDLFKIPAEVLIQRDGRVSLFSLTQDFGNGPSAAMGRSDYCHRLMIFALNDHLAAIVELYPAQLARRGQARPR